MAEGEGDEMKNLIEKFKTFAVKDKSKISGKEIGEIAKNCLRPAYETTVLGSCDIVFTKMGKKPIEINKANVEKFCELLGQQVAGLPDQKAKGKTADQHKEAIKVLILKGKKKDTTTHTTNKKSVEKMTDTSQYTGSHKERFDDTGKGKGAAGRVDKVNNTGYTGQYKGEGTYDKAKK